MNAKILVVEDEQPIADTLLYALGTEGFETTWRTTGAEALAEVAGGGVDLVLLDVGLPDGNGFDFCRRIRATSGVPVIFLTARAEEVDRVVGLEIGADDYIVKPFSPREVTARVRAVLRRSSGGRPAAPAPAGTTLLAVDRERRTVSFCGQPLDLSRYEYGILALLAGSPGRVFTRDEIMERIWEEPGMSLDRTVDTHVKNIRGKLHQLRPDLDPIRTHRGVGYSLKEPA
jgi:two-component system catabolic regulation response regulator CreB